MTRQLMIKLQRVLLKPDCHVQNPKGENITIDYDNGKFSTTALKKNWIKAGIDQRKFNGGNKTNGGRKPLPEGKKKVEIRLWEDPETFAKFGSLENYKETVYKFTHEHFINT